MKDFLKINEKDNVAVALRDIKAGERVFIDGENLLVTEDVKRGHKFAVSDISKSSDVIKYGYPIGYAMEDIKAGRVVHIDNLKTKLGDNCEYTYNPSNSGNTNIDYDIEHNEDCKMDTFMGYVRSDGRVGVRNEIWIVPTVGCVNSVAQSIEARCKELEGNGIDAVVAFNHPYGCSQMGDDQEHTREALSGLIKHPNAGGVLVLGLGCENTNIEVLKSYLGDYDKNRIRFLNAQDVEDEIEEGIEIVNELAMLLRGDVRTLQSIKKLVIGLKCGGSDGLSGITANPVVGRFSDCFIKNGGTTIMTEVPEMFGAETILMNRAKDSVVFEKIVKLINDFKDYYRRNNQVIYENPSPGNKAGGISTLEDKALGCTQKAGSLVVTDVLNYGEAVKKAGLNLLAAPGNDLVASTALVISGAQIVLFTTGRGTPFASAVPTVKISTNTALAKEKEKWIDFDCGVLIEDRFSYECLSDSLYRYVHEVAEGKYVKSEKSGFRDFAIFKQGVTL